MVMLMERPVDKLQVLRDRGDEPDVEVIPLVKFQEALEPAYSSIRNEPVEMPSKLSLLASSERLRRMGFTLGDESGIPPELTTFSFNFSHPNPSTRNISWDAPNQDPMQDMLDAMYPTPAFRQEHMNRPTEPATVTMDFTHHGGRATGRTQEMKLLARALTRLADVVLGGRTGL